MAENSERSLLTGASIVGGLVGGLVHAGVAVVLWNHWFDSLWELFSIKPLNGAYLILGMFLLGFVPVLFYVGERVISPAIVVAVFLLLSGFGSWLAGSIRAPSAVPTPFALYILFWVGIVALAGLTGGLEHRQKRQATE
ncbi:MAG: hypothetical protein V5A28_11055 [Haloarculaceae archaeon]